jgi:integrase/recombinase XerD
MPSARTFTDADIRRVFRVISAKRHKERNKAIFALGIASGARACELASLRVDQVLNSDGEIADEIVLSSEQTKGKRARQLFLGKKARDAVREYLQYRYKVVDLRQISEKNYRTCVPLFATQKAQGFSANSLVGYFSRLMREAGIRGASSHSCRHTFATSLAEKGVSPSVLQKLLGHTQLSVTQKYITVGAHTLRKAVDLI